MTRTITGNCSNVPVPAIGESLIVGGSVFVVSRYDPTPLYAGYILEKDHSGAAVKLNNGDVFVINDDGEYVRCATSDDTAYHRRRLSNMIRGAAWERAPIEVIMQVEQIIKDNEL